MIRNTKTKDKIVKWRIYHKKWNSVVNPKQTKQKNKLPVLMKNFWCDIKVKTQKPLHHLKMYE